MLSTKYQQTTTGIWKPTDKTQFNYSDGDDVENRLLQQIENCTDISQASDELQQLMVDWPSEYHFSPLRSNLLSAFQLNQFADILEIGSGCGAITRQLGENCPKSNIIALEGSARRAEITRSRCRDLENIEVCNDSFTDFETLNPFNLVTMIGVLEYSPSFFEGVDPILEALKHAHNFLSENGVLIIAIENQLGLKYFNGAAEDHNGIPFSGINDLYLPSSARTFGKKDLQQRIKQAGFKRVEFVYPFPDYKLPQLLLREEAFHSKQLDLSCLIGQYPSRDYAFGGDKIFREARVWKLLTQNGLTQDFSNSFLAFAFAGDATLDSLTDEWLAKSFSGRRKKQYLIETIFNKTQNNIDVEKKVSYRRDNMSETRSTNLIHHVGVSDYFHGIPYTHNLLEQISKTNTIEQFIVYLTPWIDWLRSHALPTTTIDTDTKLLVSGQFYDCIPSNILIGAHNELCIIDQEWEHQSPLEIGFIVFRGIYRELIENMDFLEETDLFTGKNVWDFLTTIFSYFDIEFNQQIYNNYLNLETDFQMEVVPYSTDKAGLRDHINNFITEPRTKTLSISDFLTTGGLKRYTLLIWQKQKLDQILAERDAQIIDLSNQISELEITSAQNNNIISQLENKISVLEITEAKRNEIISQLENHISIVLNSSSWKLTVPLRLCGYIIRGDFDKAKSTLRGLKNPIISALYRFLKWI